MSTPNQPPKPGQPFNPQYPSGQYPPMPQQGYPQSAPQQKYQQYPQGYPQPPYQQPPAQPPKKKRRGLLIVGIVLAVLVFGCIGSIALASRTAPATTVPTGGTSAQPTKAPATGKWTTTHSYAGNGIKKTESFAVGNDWKILWTCKGSDIGGTQADSALSITVNSSDNTPIDVASSTCKAGQTTKDSTEEHKSGTVFLDITGASDWSVSVQELK